MDYYIKSKELILKGDSILRAQFFPSRVVDEKDDSFQGEVYTEQAILYLWTSEASAEPVTDYEGNIKGAASEGTHLRFYGADAVQLWDALKLGTYQIIGEPS